MTRFLLRMIFLNSLIQNSCQEAGNHFWNEEEIDNKQLSEFCIFVLTNSQQ